MHFSWSMSQLENWSQGSPDLNSVDIQCGALQQYCHKISDIVVRKYFLCRGCSDNQLGQWGPAWKSASLELVDDILHVDGDVDSVVEARVRTHTHPFNGPFLGLPRWAGTRRVKPIWISLKQETVSGRGISWAVCKSAPRSRQMTTPAPHHSVFYRPDALPAAQPTASKHWRHIGYERDRINLSNLCLCLPRQTFFFLWERGLLKLCATMYVTALVLVSKCIS